MTRETLPWRGPGEGRPDLPIPPARMPLRSHGQNRKRWRYVGVYGDELMLCAARAQVGPFGQCFWALWDRRAGNQLEGTRLRPGSREVSFDGDEVRIDARDARARLTLGEAEPVEAVCPSGSGWGWTRKRAGLPVRGWVETAAGRREVDARGVDDQSAGYQRRRTSWWWSAGVGEAVDGRRVAWNLVEGINDPPHASERAVWVDGVPHEPGPVSFDRGLRAVRFADDALLEFTAGPERARDENFLLFRSSYRHLFGEFSGSLEGLELGRGLGVMERHEAVW